MMESGLTRQGAAAELYLPFEDNPELFFLSLQTLEPSMLR